MKNLEVNEVNEGSEQMSTMVEDSNMISVSEATALTGKSRVTVIRIIKEREIPVAGLLKTGKRGRPVKVYDKSLLLSVL